MFMHTTSTTSLPFPTAPSADLDLTEFDLIIINTSGGKDSQTMMRRVVQLAAEQGVRDRLVAVHADLGRVEWEGTAALAQRQAEMYGLRFEIKARPQGDLLAQIEARGMFPSSSARYCTSDQKRGQVRTVMTKLVKELALDRPARVLNCMGLRRQESSARAKKEELRYDASASGEGKVRQVWEWLPIIDWTEDEVWADIKASGVPYHPAYDAGMPRLSCSFCVLASKPALIRAAQLRPELAQEYADLEARIGHTFQSGRSMAEIIAEAKALGDTPIEITNWSA